MIAKDLNPKNTQIHERSLAQIVFPKAVKGSFIFGGNYAEGYLVEDNVTLAEIRMVGGNIGPNIGGQSYSQITYVMDEEALYEIKNGQNFPCKALQVMQSQAKV